MILGIGYPVVRSLTARPIHRLVTLVSGASGIEKDMISQ